MESQKKEKRKIEKKRKKKERSLIDILVPRELLELQKNGVIHALCRPKSGRHGDGTSLSAERLCVSTTLTVKKGFKLWLSPAFIY